MEHPCGTYDQILYPVGTLLSEICGLVSGGRPLWREDEVEVTLRLTVSQSVCLGIEHPRGTCDHILLPVGMLLSEICGLVSMERPLWREDGSALLKTQLNSVGLSVPHREHITSFYAHVTNKFVNVNSSVSRHISARSEPDSSSMHVRWLPTAAAWVLLHVRACGICGRQMALG
jgi:hypothetical protein